MAFTIPTGNLRIHWQDMQTHNGRCIGFENQHWITDASDVQRKNVTLHRCHSILVQKDFCDVSVKFIFHAAFEAVDIASFVMRIER